MPKLSNSISSFSAIFVEPLAKVANAILPGDSRRKKISEAKEPSWAKDKDANEWVAENKVADRRLILDRIFNARNGKVDFSGLRMEGFVSAKLLERAPKLTVITASSARIDAVPEECIEHLVNVYHFNLNDNSLSGLPKNIGEMIGLRIFWANKNHLEVLPDSFGNLFNLEQLDLKKTDLKALPKDFCNLINLRSIDLEENYLESIPGDIGKMQSLKRLKLANNNLRELPGQIGLLNNLAYLDVSNNHLYDSDDGPALVRAIPEAVGELKNGKSSELTINFAGNKKLMYLPNKFDSFSYEKDVRANYKGHVFSYVTPNTLKSGRVKFYLDDTKVIQTMEAEERLKKRPENEHSVRGGSRRHSNWTVSGLDAPQPRVKREHPPAPSHHGDLGGEEEGVQQFPGFPPGGSQRGASADGMPPRVQVSPEQHSAALRQMRGAGVTPEAAQRSVRGQYFDIEQEDPQMAQVFEVDPRLNPRNFPIYPPFQATAEPFMRMPSSNGSTRPSSAHSSRAGAFTNPLPQTQQGLSPETFQLFLQFQQFMQFQQAQQVEAPTFGMPGGARAMPFMYQQQQQGQGLPNPTAAQFAGGGQFFTPGVPGGYDGMAHAPFGGAGMNGMQAGQPSMGMFAAAQPNPLMNPPSSNPARGAVNPAVDDDFEIPEHLSKDMKMDAREDRLQIFCESVKPGVASESELKNIANEIKKEGITDGEKKKRIEGLAVKAFYQKCLHDFARKHLKETRADNSKSVNDDAVTQLSVTLQCLALVYREEAKAIVGSTVQLPGKINDLADRLRSGKVGLALFGRFKNLENLFQDALQYLSQQLHEGVVEDDRFIGKSTEFTRNLAIIKDLRKEENSYMRRGMREDLARK